MGGHLRGDSPTKRVDSQLRGRIEERGDRRPGREQFQPVSLGPGGLQRVSAGTPKGADAGPEREDAPIVTRAASPADLEAFGQAIVQPVEGAADDLGVGAQAIGALERLAEVLGPRCEELGAERGVRSIRQRP